jgi:hypothetical protein
MAGGESLLDNKAACATRGSDDYQVHFRPPTVSLLEVEASSMLPFQTVEASSYSDKR